MAMNFGDALVMLRSGQHVSRLGWNGKDMFLFLVDTWKIEDTFMREFITMKTAQGDYVPWVASQSDLLGLDWMVI